MSSHTPVYLCYVATRRPKNHVGLHNAYTTKLPKVVFATVRIERVGVHALVCVRKNVKRVHFIFYCLLPVLFHHTLCIIPLAALFCLIKRFTYLSRQGIFTKNKHYLSNDCCRLAQQRLWKIFMHSLNRKMNSAWKQVFLV